jgi:hypothetical protein
MNKIKIYQMDESGLISNPKHFGYIIRESDYPHLMIRNLSFPSLGPPNTYKGEKYRNIIKIGRKKVIVQGNWGWGDWEHIDKTFLEELDKMEIPYILCPTPYGHRIEIPREYFELYKLGTY